MPKNKYWISFSSIENIDSEFILRLYNYFGDIETAWNADKSELQHIDGLSIKKSENFMRERAKINIDEKFELIEKHGVKFLTFENEKYPERLKEIYNPPAVLYYKGDLTRVNFNRTLAVVGSRRASSYAKDALKKVLSGLFNTDITIVSGLASGIDTTAHEIAIANGLTTIGVIASGFDYTYPAANKHLYEKIENEFGLIFTEYYPTFEPLKYRFPQRNRIVSGLCAGTVVAEASMKSGALITANLTLEQGRELMCIPGLITNPNTEGIYKLIKNGASIVTETADILNTLGWQVEGQLGLKLNADPELTKTEAQILNTIAVEEKAFDQIQTETGLEIDTLLTDLTMLELKGIIKRVGRDSYRKDV